MLSLAAIACIVGLNGCIDYDPPPLGDPGMSDVSLPAFYLVFCGNPGVWGASDGNVRFEVIGMDANGNMVEIDDQTFDITNDDADSDNLTFRIMVPETGNYMVVATVEIDCHDCCNDIAVDGHCDIPESGTASFYGESVQIMAGAFRTISLEPTIDECENCGC